MAARLLTALTLLVMPALPMAETIHVVRQVEVPEWKAVFGRIEARDRVPARSRLGGTISSIDASEGLHVEEGQQIATVHDEKLTLQLEAIDATLSSLSSQLENAETELQRGESLLQRGVTTVQRLDQLRTEVDVIQGRIGTTEAERRVLEQREAEGAVLAPISGTVLAVPVTEGSVILPGEPVAMIGGGGFYLRIAVPERHATFLEEGAQILIGNQGQAREGRLAKIYPLIENGRVIADVEVDDLPTDFVDARVLVRLPVGRSSALLVPANAVETRMGLDFVTIAGPDDAPVRRAVVVGSGHNIDGTEMVEIHSGLSEGDTLVSDHE